MNEARPGLRLDKWLWHARFFRTRSVAADIAARRRVRINGDVTGKPHQLVRPGDVVTFPQGDRVRVVRVVSLGVRRGPAAEAQALYADVETAGSPAVGTVR